MRRREVREVPILSGEGTGQALRAPSGDGAEAGDRAAGDRGDRKGCGPVHGGVHITLLMSCREKKLKNTVHEAT